MERLTEAELAQEEEWSATPAGREIILKACLERLEILARHFTKRGNLCEPDDLVSVGFIALTEAMARWEPRPGIPFWAYAKQSVKSAMVRALKAATTPQAEIDPDIMPAKASGEVPILEGLTPRQRQIVEMRLLQTPQQSEREICRDLGLSLPDLRQELWQALETLRANKSLLSRRP
jgi:RNA polymerase sigma factor (sigma-70 family)